MHYYTCVCAPLQEFGKMPIRIMNKRIQQRDACEICEWWCIAWHSLRVRICIFFDSISPRKLFYLCLLCVRAYCSLASDSYLQIIQGIYDSRQTCSAALILCVIHDTTATIHKNLFNITGLHHSRTSYCFRKYLAHRRHFCSRVAER